MPRSRNPRLSVKVTPGASRSGVAGWLGDTLRVRVTAAPEKGKANAAVRKTVAEALNVSPALVRIVSGLTSSRKTIEIEGLSEDEIRKRLSR